MRTRWFIAIALRRPLSSTGRAHLDPALEPADNLLRAPASRVREGDQGGVRVGLARALLELVDDGVGGR